MTKSTKVSTLVFWVSLVLFVVLFTSLILFPAKAQQSGHFINDSHRAASASDADPCQLSGFDAQPKGNKAELTWSTANEKKIEFFIIQRSRNGQSGWEDIGTVTAAGDNVANRSYRFIDKDVVNEINFYRLQELNNDGTYVYSKMVMARFGESAGQKFLVYPNPCTTSINITLSSRLQTAVIATIINESGQVAMQKTANVHEGTNTISFDGLDHVPTGVYLIRITGKMVSVTQKIVKQ